MTNLKNKENLKMSKKINQPILTVEEAKQGFLCAILDSFGIGISLKDLEKMWATLTDVDVDPRVRTSDVQKKDFPPYRVRFTDTGGKRNKKSEMIDPVDPDLNYPVKGYFNVDKKTTVLVFPDKTKVKVVADAETKNKNAHNGVIIALARKVLDSRTSLSDLYSKFKTDSKTESMFYGVVMGYFVSNGIVRDAEMFDKWLVEFIATRLEISNKTK
jgi:hypothetical protein